MKPQRVSRRYGKPYDKRLCVRCGEEKVGRHPSSWLCASCMPIDTAETCREMSERAKELYRLKRDALLGEFAGPQFCIYCGALGPLQIDHVTPRARGGTDDPENLVLACADCNAMKNDHAVIVFLARRMKLLEFIGDPTFRTLA